MLQNLHMLNSLMRSRQNISNKNNDKANTLLYQSHSSRLNIHIDYYYSEFCNWYHNYKKDTQSTKIHCKFCMSNGIFGISLHPINHKIPLGTYIDCSTSFLNQQSHMFDIQFSMHQNRSDMRNDIFRTQFMLVSVLQTNLYKDICCCQNHDLF